MVKTPSLKPCPFCGSKDICYSTKISRHFEVRYFATMYCNKCHCYGPRTLSKVINRDDYKCRDDIAKDDTIKANAIDAWNRRAKT